MGRLKVTEQNLIVCVGKSEAEVTNNKRLHSRYSTVEANYRQRVRHEALDGLYVTAELSIS